MVSLVIAGLFPAFAYIKVDTLDRANSIRIGVFFFIILSVIGNQIQNSNKMSKAIKYDFVKELAYKDGLTGLGNRTSYLEKLSEYEKDCRNEIGIVFLDINNLKIINDKFGHNMGDEFCVFIEGGNVVNDYENAKSKFETIMNEKHENLLKEIELKIAHGFEVYNPESSTLLKDVIKEADKKMYINKSNIKGETV